jgi:uncharacterized metal-binding protein (TIGR02443 family)
MKPNQRFIAGARCPKCQSIDSLLINQDDQSIECVDCDYSETPEERDKKQNQSQAATGDINIKLIND